MMNDIFEAAKPENNTELPLDRLLLLAKLRFPVSHIKEPFRADALSLVEGAFGGKAINKVNIGPARAGELLNLPAVANDADTMNRELSLIGQGNDGIFYAELKLFGADLVSGVFVTDPVLYNEINNLTDPNGEKVFRDRAQMHLIEKVMGPSVLTSNGDVIKDRRAKMGRMLSGKKLSQEYAQMFNSIVSDEFIKIAQKLFEQGSVNIDANELITVITQSSIASALFGEEMNKGDMKKVAEIGDALRNYFALSTINETVGKVAEGGAKKKLEKDLIEKILVPSTVGYLHDYKDGLSAGIEKPALKGFGELIADMVSPDATPETIQIIIDAFNEKDYETASKYLKITDEKGKTVYDLDKLLADEAIMFLAGIDTTAAAMQNICYLFAEDHVSEKPYDHSAQKLFFDGKLSEEDILNTTLNVRPPVGLIQRESKFDAVLSNGVIIPAGTIVSFPLELLNRKAREGGMTDFDVTFATGPRSCLGEAFARREILEFLKAMRELGIIIRPGEKYNPVFTSTPAAGVRGLDLSLEKVRE